MKSRVIHRVCRSPSLEIHRHPAQSSDSGAYRRGIRLRARTLFERTTLSLGKGKNMSDAQALIWKLARIAHETWCDRMIQDGWRAGTEFDANARTHDALVPFDQLDAIDRRSTYLGIATADIASEIEKACQYTRSEPRELGTCDMHVGLRVRSCDTPTEIGTVESWEEDRNFPGTLNSIRVRWDSGEVVDHAAPEREFRPLTDYGNDGA